MLALAGCTAQVNSNTLDMQASYRGLFTKQILYNLGQAIDDPHFFPSQFLIGTGTATTSNTITPGISLPLPAITSAYTGTSAAAFSGANTVTTAWGNATLSLPFADTWGYTWGVTPRTDPDELRRLRALYLYAVGNLPKPCRDESGSDVGQGDACFKALYVMQGGLHNVNQVFTQKPNCVLCGSAKDQSALHLNERLARLSGFITKTAPTENADQYKMYRYGSSYFYVKKDDGEEYFNDLMLFVLEAMSSAPFLGYGDTLEKETVTTTTETTNGTVTKTTRSVTKTQPVPPPPTGVETKEEIRKREFKPEFRNADPGATPYSVPVPPKIQFPQSNNGFSLPM